MLFSQVENNGNFELVELRLSENFYEDTLSKWLKLRGEVWAGDVNLRAIFI